MKEIKISKNDSGIRFDKYLKKLFINAGSGFLYKMLRKKNITLNDQKADGKEILKVGDSVKVFFSDETYNKFTADQNVLSKEFEALKNLKYPKPEIIFENEDLILYNKPQNLLSQKAKADDISANEILISYMINQHELTEEDYQTFHPSVCNRLDQNTTGILVFGKSMKGLQEMSEALKNRTAHKYYYAIVNGKFTQNGTFRGYIKKDGANNTVTVYDIQKDGADYIETGFSMIQYHEKYDFSFIEIELFTGKTHQIRAHLAQIGHPIIGDYKYGNRSVNDRYKANYGICTQLLHAHKIVLPNLGTFEASLPKDFNRLLDGGI
ncbi:MAG: RluA family pseudouridine synthase [Lachnospiraceae bacterium]|nr:RluA family pseudouridine synthase [Lachnospiraceae bacterium]